MHPETEEISIKVPGDWRQLAETGFRAVEGRPCVQTSERSYNSKRAAAVRRLRAAGLQVLVVDADPQQSAIEWRAATETSSLPFQVLALPSPALHRELPGIVAPLTM